MRQIFLLFPHASPTKPAREPKRLSSIVNLWYNPASFLGAVENS